MTDISTVNRAVRKVFDQSWLIRLATLWWLYCSASAWAEPQTSSARLRTYIAPFYATALFDRNEGAGVGTGQIVEGQLDGQIRDDRIDDVVAGISVGLERSWKNYVIGGDLSFRYRADWDLTAPTPSIQSVTNVFSNVQTTNAVLYAGRTWQFSGNRISLGGGVGVVLNRVDSEYIEREVPGIRAEQRFEAQAYLTEFSWIAFAKWSYPISQSWDIGLGYRYSDLGSVRTDDFVQRPGRFQARHTSHDLVLSFARRLR